MDALTDFLATHETLAVFLLVLAEQSGIPVPATPGLLAFGAAKAAAPAQFGWGIAVTTLAAVIGDVLWYGLGRRYGRPMLSALCRVSMEPASCAKRATDAFGRRGPQVLLFAKFIPGVSTTAPTLAALLGVQPAQFLLWDGVGSALWVTVFMVAGAVFREQVELVVATAQRLGGRGLAALLAGVAVYVAVKALNRHRFLRRLRMDRISPGELATLMSSGTPVTIADLRHDLDVERDGQVIPGAVRLSPDALAEGHAQLPRDRDVVLYCSCPDEATSAAVALRLRARGVSRIRPLAGGFDAWQAAGYPVAPVGVPAPAVDGGQSAR